MKRPAKFLTACAFAGLVAIVAVSGLDALSAREPAAAGKTRPAAFLLCAGCHSTEPGKHIFGPSLAGVSGRKAGSVPGFAYSKALKGSDFAWNRANLDAWLISPEKFVPGTRMPFTGIADPAKRKEVVDYLLTLD